MNDKVKAFLLATTMAVSLSAMVGCGSANSTTGTTVGTTGDSATSHLNFGCYRYTDSIDPVVNVNSSWAGLRYGVTECLFKFDDAVVAQPNLCESITITKHGQFKWARVLSSATVTT